MRQRKIEFPALDSSALRGTLSLPDAGTGPLPAVVMGAGLGALKEWLDPFAEVFTAAGLAVITWDQRGFGQSDGPVRQEGDPFGYVRDWRQALAYAAGLPEIDAGRIGIWGTSYAGGVAMIVAAIDRHVRCVVSQVPMVSGYALVTSVAPPDALRELTAQVDEDRAARLRGAAPQTIPQIPEEPGADAFTTDDETRDWINAMRGQTPWWRNELTLRTADNTLEFDASPYAARISPKPLLVIVAADDPLTPPDVTIKAYESAGEPKRLLRLSGDHYGPYQQHFEVAAFAARDWFSSHLVEDRVPASA
jgi:cephalosporin-C deacetylase-like acetyl esterase